MTGLLALGRTLRRCGIGFTPRLSFRRHSGQPAVGRVRNERSSVIPLPLDRPDGAVIARVAVDAFEPRLVPLTFASTV